MNEVNFYTLAAEEACVKSEKWEEIMWLHGPTKRDTNKLLVEDNNGWVHVVSKDMVKETVSEPEWPVYDEAKGG